MLERIKNLLLTGMKLKGNPFEWFKTLLQPGHYSEGTQYVQEVNSKLESLKKSADEDYLKRIWKTGKKNVKWLLGNNFESIYDFKVVLTVPAAWKPIAKDRTLSVARAAGFQKTSSLCLNLKLAPYIRCYKERRIEL
ncbi:hypothetical protein TWF694_001411 [Orbilia ellipsospora]|uniref:Uncharacterized protein n=1 Tax=Orbilia ellipsospora TaxID=2528407 RepID=A0AAV9XSC1_9PEZI